MPLRPEHRPRPASSMFFCACRRGRCQAGARSCRSGFRGPARLRAAEAAERAGRRGVGQHAVAARIDVLPAIGPVDAIAGLFGHQGARRRNRRRHRAGFRFGARRSGRRHHHAGAQAQDRGVLRIGQEFSSIVRQKRTGRPVIFASITATVRSCSCSWRQSPRRDRARSRGCVLSEMVEDPRQFLAQREGVLVLDQTSIARRSTRASVTKGSRCSDACARSGTHPRTHGRSFRRRRLSPVV
jgi:hypothetical protein